MTPPSRSHEPWWVAQVQALVGLQSPESLAIGPLWKVLTGFSFVHENVEPGLLEVDLRTTPSLRALWEELLALEGRVLGLLESRRGEIEGRVRTGALGPEGFRESWESLGEGADDYLDGLMAMSRLTTGEDRPPFGQVNMSSRAARISDFLTFAKPGAQDIVYDIGSGNGKFALTVAASARTRVRGVEYGARYVDAARRTGERLALENADFICSDVRDVDLSDGTTFYLFHPFWGEVAETVAQRLGALARTKDIRVFVQGPAFGFGQYFLEEVSRGALALVERVEPGPSGWTFVSAGTAHAHGDGARPTSCSCSSRR